jgi:hypothetical protein
MVDLGLLYLALAWILDRPDIRNEVAGPRPVEWWK